ncbi:hypothetical protein [Halorussus sp. AFM4]|uniref:hypothetical protein n=1 Tax=Halorussus sp. AFM4 TaxID=3421651 RepID=UPI003EBC5496
MNLLKELDGNGWSIQQALLTTFSFDPRFFSEYVRPRLRKRNCDLPAVFVDDHRYGQNIDTEEWLEAPIGSHYLLEPVQTGGVFHPKVNLFASERSVYATVSSANLTLEEYAKAAQVGQSVGFQRSWLEDEERNLSEEYHLVRDIRRFFASLAGDEHHITGREASEYVEETLATLEWLDDYEAEVSGRSESGRTTRFIHNLDAPILQQALDLVGEVETVQVYAPFYGSPSVVDDILSATGADRAELIVESESTTLDLEGLPDALDIPFDVREMNHETTRWVHGKFLTFRGPWGSACLFGSPNLTSTALLQDTRSGNCEAALLSVFPDERSPPEGTLFGNEAFEFDLSAPVERLETLSVRDRSYEGWEAIQDTTKGELRLLDARLTQPDSDDVSELILKLDGLTGTCSLEIETERETVSQRVEADIDDGELSILVEEDNRKHWAAAVVTVTALDKDVVSNPRRVNEESQAYFREYREITQSGGTQSSTTLLKQILQNPDTAAISVFDVALSELRELSSDQSTERPTEQDSTPTFEERSPARLTGSASSTPSIHTLVDRQLAYQLEQAQDALEFDDLPTPAEVESFQTHLETFFETMELCIMLDLMDELDNEKVLGVCQQQFHSFLELHPQFTTAISRLSDLIEDNNRVNDAFVGDADTDARDLDFWEDAFDLLYIHPAIILELDYKSVEPVIRSHNQFVNRLKKTLESSAPALWRYLFDFSYLEDAIDTHTQNLLVRYADEDPSVEITGEAVRAILLYILVQRSRSNSDFLEELANHPRYGDEAVRDLAQFALTAEQALFDYEIVNKQLWGIVLKQGRESVEAFAKAER